MEDIFGRYELDLKKLENVDMVIDVVKKRFGLNTKINSKTPRSYIGSAYREMVKYVGKIERETFNFLNIEEAVEFYKNEYGLDFDFILTDDLDGSYGRTTRALNIFCSRRSKKNSANIFDTWRRYSNRKFQKARPPKYDRL